jgi:hypothetical protein
MGVARGEPAGGEQVGPGEAVADAAGEPVRAGPSRLVPDVIDGEIIDDQPEDAPAPRQRTKARR